MWEDLGDRSLMLTQLQKGPVRSVITKLRAKSGELKLTAYSADRVRFDGLECILAVSEDVPQYEQRQTN
jgi:hypothetical protein